MKFYDDTKLLYLETDASAVGLGAAIANPELASIIDMHFTLLSQGNMSLSIGSLCISLIIA